MPALIGAVVQFAVVAGELLESGKSAISCKLGQYCKLKSAFTLLLRPCSSVHEFTASTHWGGLSFFVLLPRK
jgi:hypothetical protein